MKNLSLFTLQSYIRGFLLCALIVANGIRMSAQYDLLYENHEQNLMRETWAIADDGQGNTYLGGKFAVSLTLGTYTLTNTGSTETGNGQTGFIGKFNSASNTWLWAKKITLMASSGQLDWITHSVIIDLAIDNAGNVYITGQYSGIVSFDNIVLSSTKLSNQYTPDIFVAKYNTNGGVVWVKSFGTKAGADQSSAISLDGSGNIFIGGFFTNKTINCGQPFTTTYLYDVYLAKLTNAGTALWQKRYAIINPTCGGGNFSSGRALSIDAAGNAFLAGQFSGTVSFGSGSGLTITSLNGGVDVFAAKINGSGTTQWVRSAGSSAYDYGETIYADASGNVYAGGKVTDAFLTKYNSTGDVVWSVNPYPSSPDFPFSTISRITPYSTSILVNDPRVGFKTISPTDGSVISSDSLVGNEPSDPSAITDVALAGAGYVFSMRGRCGTITIGNTTLTSYNNCPYSGNSSDIFMVRTGEAPLPFQVESDITDPLATFHEFAQNEMDVYPNPASDIIHVTIPDSEKETTLFIQNQFGRTVWSEKFEPLHRSVTITLDGNKFQSGVYYLVFLSEGVVKTKRLVIDR